MEKKFYAVGFVALLTICLLAIASAVDFYPQGNIDLMDDWSIYNVIDFNCQSCINSSDVNDLDSGDIEGDINTFVDIAGDHVAGTLYISASGDALVCDEGDVNIAGDLNAMIVQGGKFKSIDANSVYGISAVAIGSGATAFGEYSFALGPNTVAGGEDAIAMGYAAEASGNEAVAIGYYANADCESCIALGDESEASNQYALAIGLQTVSKGLGSAAIGYQCLASGEGSVALGHHPYSTGTGSVAMGYNTFGAGVSKLWATGDGAVALGYGDSNHVASGKGSVALGYNCIAKGEASICLGKGLTNYAPNSVLVQDFNALGDANFTNIQADKFFSFSSLGDANMATLGISGQTYASNFVNLHADPTNSLHAATKGYVDVAASGLEFEYFLTDTTSDIADYNVMVDTDTGEAESTVTSAVLNAGLNQLILNFATQAGQPEFNSLLSSTYDGHFHMAKTGGASKVIKVYWKLFERDSGGVEMEIMQSEESEEVAAKGPVDIHAALGTDERIDDNRMVLKVYANVVGGGETAQVVMYQEGTTDSHVSLKPPTSALDQLYLTRAGSNWMNADLNVGGYDIINATDANFGGDVNIQKTLSVVGDSNFVNLGAVRFHGDGSGLTNLPSGLTQTDANLLYVPYIEANEDVNLGEYGLTANDLNAMNIGLAGSIYGINSLGDANFSNLQADNIFGINSVGDANFDHLEATSFFGGTYYGDGSNLSGVLTYADANDHYVPYVDADFDVNLGSYGLAAFGDLNIGDISMIGDFYGLNAEGDANFVNVGLSGDIYGINSLVDANFVQIQATNYYGTWSGNHPGAAYDTNFTGFADFNSWYASLFDTNFTTIQADEFFAFNALGDSNIVSLALSGNLYGINSLGDANFAQIQSTNFYGGTYYGDGSNLAGVTTPSQLLPDTTLDNNTDAQDWFWTELNLLVPWADANVADDITLTNITQITNRSYSDLSDTPTILKDTTLDTNSVAQTWFRTELNANIPWADVNVADDITLDNLTQITTRNYSDLTGTPTILKDSALDTNTDAQTWFWTELNLLIPWADVNISTYTPSEADIDQNAMLLDTNWSNTWGTFDANMQSYYTLTADINSAFVPYIDGIGDVNLGVYGLTANDINVMHIGAPDFYGGTFHGLGVGLTDMTITADINSAFVPYIDAVTDVNLGTYGVSAFGDLNFGDVGMIGKFFDLDAAGDANFVNIGTSGDIHVGSMMIDYNGTALILGG